MFHCALVVRWGCGTYSCRMALHQIGSGLRAPGRMSQIGSLLKCNGRGDGNDGCCGGCQRCCLPHREQSSHCRVRRRDGRCVGLHNNIRSVVHSWRRLGCFVLVSLGVPIVSAGLVGGSQRAVHWGWRKRGSQVRTIENHSMCIGHGSCCAIRVVGDGHVGRGGTTVVGSRVLP